MGPFAPRNTAHPFYYGQGIRHLFIQLYLKHYSYFCFLSVSSPCPFSYTVSPLPFSYLIEIDKSSCRQRWHQQENRKWSERESYKRPSEITFRTERTMKEMKANNQTGRGKYEQNTSLTRSVEFRTTTVEAPVLME